MFLVKLRRPPDRCKSTQCLGTLQGTLETCPRLTRHTQELFGWPHSLTLFLPSVLSLSLSLSIGRSLSRLLARSFLSCPPSLPSLPFLHFKYSSALELILSRLHLHTTTRPGVAFEVRPAILQATSTAEALEVVLKGIRSSINHVNGTKPLF
jgi:hypothetical protein